MPSASPSIPGLTPVALDRNPVSGKWEEKHLSSPPSVPSEKKTHLYSHLSAENAEKTAGFWRGPDPL
jgi:cbb3-type cytochrome oxidase cytochrome c subunit